MTYTRLSDEELRQIQRATYWDAMRDVCADIRGSKIGGHWRAARYKTLAYYYRLWREAYGPRKE